jgi:hypothetical protein
VSKGPRQKPKFAGLDERDATNNQSDVPSTYFAGVAKLNGSPLMTQVITKIKNSGGGK